MVGTGAFTVPDMLVRVAWRSRREPVAIHVASASPVLLPSFQRRAAYPVSLQLSMGGAASSPEVVETSL